MVDEDAKSGNLGLVEVDGLGLDLVSPLRQKSEGTAGAKDKSTLALLSFHVNAFIHIKRGRKEEALTRR